MWPLRPRLHIDAIHLGVGREETFNRGWSVFVAHDIGAGFLHICRSRHSERLGAMVALTTVGPDFLQPLPRKVALLTKPCDKTATWWPHCVIAILHQGIPFGDDWVGVLLLVPHFSMLRH